jgi:hypothetical protein
MQVHTQAMTRRSEPEGRRYAHGGWTKPAATCIWYRGDDTPRWHCVDLSCTSTDIVTGLENRRCAPGPTEFNHLLTGQAGRPEKASPTSSGFEIVDARQGNRCA